MEEPTGWLAVVRDAFSAIGILAFAISGALLAVQKRMDVVGMAGLAVVTATGGGMLRDALANDIPAVFRRDSRLYLLPALVGSSGAAAAVALGYGHWLVLAIIAAVVTALRIMSELLRWHVPALKTEAIPTIRD